MLQLDSTLKCNALMPDSITLLSKTEKRQRMGYKQLTNEQRYTIEVLLQTPMSLRAGKILSIGIFYRSDIDCMTNDEFKKKHPVKRYWDLSLEDLEECDWTVIYSEERFVIRDTIPKF